MSKFFKNFAWIFFEMLLNNLNTHDQIEHLINFVKEKTSRINCVYNISQNKFIAFRNYIANILKKNWIRFFNESIEAFILFIKKFDDNLRFCVNYRKFNKIIIKNKYLLSFFLKTLKRFAKARKFIKIDIHNTYYRIWIRKNNEWKIAFRIRYDQFEYQIMSFNFINVFVIFQSYVNRAFKSYINIYCVIYLNDVLIYLKIEKQHWKNVYKILRALFAHQLYAKLSKCAFNCIEIFFFWFHNKSTWHLNEVITHWRH